MKEEEPLAAMPPVDLYFYIPDCWPCVQMLQLKGADLATWCVNGAHLQSITLLPEVQPEGQPFID